MFHTVNDFNTEHLLIILIYTKKKLHNITDLNKMGVWNWILGTTSQHAKRYACHFLSLIFMYHMFGIINVFGTLYV